MTSSKEPSLSELKKRLNNQFPKSIRAKAFFDELSKDERSSIYNSFQYTRIFQNSNLFSKILDQALSRSKNASETSEIEHLLSRAYEIDQTSANVAVTDAFFRRPTEIEVLLKLFSDLNLPDDFQQLLSSTPHKKIAPLFCQFVPQSSEITDYSDSNNYYRAHNQPQYKFGSSILNVSNQTIKFFSDLFPATQLYGINGWSNILYYAIDYAETSKAATKLLETFQLFKDKNQIPINKSAKLSDEYNQVMCELKEISKLTTIQEPKTEKITILEKKETNQLKKLLTGHVSATQHIDAELAMKAPPTLGSNRLQSLLPSLIEKFKELAKIELEIEQLYVSGTNFIQKQFSDYYAQNSKQFVSSKFRDLLRTEFLEYLKTGAFKYFQDSEQLQIMSSVLKVSEESFWRENVSIKNFLDCESTVFLRADPQNLRELKNLLLLQNQLGVSNTQLEQEYLKRIATQFMQHFDQIDESSNITLTNSPEIVKKLQFYLKAFETPELIVQVISRNFYGPSKLSSHEIEQICNYSEKSLSSEIFPSLTLTQLLDYFETSLQSQNALQVLLYIFDTKLGSMEFQDLPDFSKMSISVLEKAFEINAQVAIRLIFAKQLYTAVQDGQMSSNEYLELIQKSDTQINKLLKTSQL